jgi:hypothetical protein
MKETPDSTLIPGQWMDGQNTPGDISIHKLANEPKQREITPEIQRKEPGYQC